MSNLSYELAKELKDGGFPQDLAYSTCVHEENRVPCEASKDVRFSNSPCEFVYFPGLSELIEACGIGIYGLHRSGELWNAVSDDRKSGKAISISASSPEEAVALLWVALNKK